jgi:hypothetical protein
MRHYLIYEENQLTQSVTFELVGLRSMNMKQILIR